MYIQCTCTLAHIWVNLILNFLHLSFLVSWQELGNIRKQDKEEKEDEEEEEEEENT